MQTWYTELTQPGGPLGAGQPFSVTGYSLGGHLATAFNMMYAAAKETVTFNGAGIGGIDPSVTLKGLVDTFTDLSTHDYSSHISDASLNALYTRASVAIKGGGSISAADLSTLQDLGYPQSGNFVDAQTKKDARMVLDAASRINTIRSEVSRLAGLTSGDGKTPNPIANSAIAQVDLDYQMAVLSVKTYTDAASLLSGVARTFKGKVNTITLDNQFDVVGETSPSAVSNSQWHIGTDIKVFIEDQPLYRGGVVSGVVLDSLRHLDVKLLVNGYASKDFGDTHSLVLLVDSLNVQNTLLQMLPSSQRNGASALINTILKDASNLIKVDGDLVFGSGQGKAEGDVLENTLNALADLVLGPTIAAQTRLKGATDGGTWADAEDKNGYTGRDRLYALIQKIQNSALFKAAANGSVTLQLGTSNTQIATQARTDFGAYAALHSLSPFVMKFGASAAEAEVKALWGSVYTDWTTTADHPSIVSDDWLRDRAALLERKSYFNTANASYDSSKLNAWGTKDGQGNPINTKFDLEDVVWKWKEGTTDQTIRRGNLTGSTRYVVFGGEDDDTNVAGDANNDRLYGGAGNDTLNGMGGNDYLEGGSGTDTYKFTGTWGKDTIVDTDGKGKLTIDGQSIGLAQAIGTPGSSTWRYEISPGVGVFLKVIDDSHSSSGKSLVITKGSTTATSGDPANSITVQNFDLTAAKTATGYLGIKLDPVVKVAAMASGSLPNGQSNFFNTPGADVSTLAGQASNIVEGLSKTFTVFFSEAAKANGTITLALADGIADKFNAVLGDRTVDANGAVITLAQGQTQVSFALLQVGDVSADLNGAISVSYLDAGADPSTQSVSNSWGLGIQNNPDPGVPTLTLQGDHQFLDLQGNPSNSPSTLDATLNFATSAAPLEGAQDVLFGSAANEQIEGLGGNDLLSGMQGDDVLQGGDGSDIINGGLGADNISGGDGDDIISGSGAGIAFTQDSLGGYEGLSWPTFAQPDQDYLLGTGLGSVAAEGSHWALRTALSEQGRIDSRAIASKLPSAYILSTVSK